MKALFCERTSRLIALFPTFTHINEIKVFLSELVDCDEVEEIEDWLTASVHISDEKTLNVTSDDDNTDFVIVDLPINTRLTTDLFIK